MFKFVFCVWLHFTLCCISFFFITIYVSLVTCQHFMLLDAQNVMVDNSGATSIFEQCLCTMFLFQLRSLHISKDVSYDYNNLVLNSMYQIPMTSSQGRQWVVGCGHYCIIGDSLTHNF
jgi:hypothetical protein